MNNREFERDWRIYEANTRDGEVPSLHALGLRVGRPRTLGFAGSALSREQQQQAELVVARLLTHWSEHSETFAKEGIAMNDEQKLLDLCLEFLKEAEHGQVDKVKQYLEMGVPVNFQHPRTKHTAMHCATFGNGDEDYQRLARFLLDSGHEINFLLEDSLGRMPYQCANLFDFDEALSQEIYDRTKIQADKIGLDLQQDFLQKFRKWMHTDWYRNLSRDHVYEPDRHNHDLK